MSTRVVILGGGYAGLACGLKLARQKDITVNLTLIDRNSFFLDSTKLHESVHYDLSRFQIAYDSLSARQGIQFIQSNLKFEPKILSQWQEKKTLYVDGKEISFDYLVISTGSFTRNIGLSKEYQDPQINKEIVTLEQIKKNGAQMYLEDCLSMSKKKRENRKLSISVIGGGATGIQFLFQIHSWYRKKNIDGELRLIDANDSLLKGFPDSFHNYCHEKIKKNSISYYPNLKFLSQEKTKLVCADKNVKPIHFSSNLTFLFPGVQASPFIFSTDSYGRVIYKNQTLKYIYSAGDCSFYSDEDGNAAGNNQFSAQVAVRKGRLIAENIVRQNNQQRLLRYLYPILGTFVSLGTWDGIGWLLFNFNVLKGSAAVAVKKSIEGQFRFFLAGLDTYVDL